MGVTVKANQVSRVGPMLFLAFAYSATGLAQQDDERTRGTPTPGFLLTPLLAVYGLDANAPKPLQIVSTQVTLPPSREPARVANPPCPADPNIPASADAVVKGLGATANSVVFGAPLLSPALQNNAVNGWVKSRLGISNGPAVCQLMCVAIPGDARVIQEDTCVADNEGRHCAMVQGHSAAYTDYWGGVEAAGVSAMAANRQTAKTGSKAKTGAKTTAKSSATAQGGQIVCGLAKSWSQNRTRIVSWNVWFQ